MSLPKSLATKRRPRCAGKAELMTRTDGSMEKGDKSCVFVCCLFWVSIVTPRLLKFNIKGGYCDDSSRKCPGIWDLKHMTLDAVKKISPELLPSH